MGGLIQLKSLIQHPHLQELFTAQVCSSPLTGLALPVPQWKQTGSKLMNQIYPQITLHNEIKNTDVTRDPEVIKDFEKDPLRHNRISPGAYLGFLSSFEYIHPHANEIKMPTLFQLPEADPVVSTPDNRRFFDQMSSRIKKLKLYPEAKHEMYNDIHRKQVYQDLKDFLVRMSEPQND